MLNFYQQMPVFALKKCPRPQRPMKANKGQQSLKLQISFLLSSFNAKSSINVNMILKECVFLKKPENFHFHYINFLKLNFVEYPNISNEIMILVASIWVESSILRKGCGPW